jgi:dihydroorotase
VTVLDLAKKRQVDPARFESRSRNTPFAGWILKGWPVMTIVGGRVAWKDAR